MFRFCGLFSLLSFVSLFCAYEICALGCKGYKNEDVDWFMAYKLPKISESKNSQIKQGVAYMYMTNESPTWNFATKNNITSEKSIIGNTLAPVYKDKNASDTLWFLYNDQPPNKSYSSKYGHTKGVVMVNQNEGFWLVHSVPNFPPVPFGGITKGKHVLPKESEPEEGKYGYPDSGLPNGQSFLCISVKNEEFNNIGLQLMLNQIIVFRRKVSKTFNHKFENLTSAAKQVRIRNGPLYRLSNISVNGNTFVSFAKNSAWDKDLYDDLVAPHLKSDILAETWLNGRDKMPSDCNATKVYNVNSLYVSSIETFFKSSNDHSKWAVAMNEGKNWVCIGDINRARTQFKRGGGTVCYKSLPVWQAYRSLVHDIEPCPLPRNQWRQNRKSYLL